MLFVWLTRKYLWSWLYCGIVLGFATSAAVVGVVLLGTSHYCHGIYASSKYIITIAYLIIYRLIYALFRKRAPEPQ